METSQNSFLINQLQLQPTDVYSLSSEEIKIKLKRLFLYYSCIGTRNKTSTISHQKLSLLFVDAGIQGKLLHKNTIDIIVSGELKRNRSILFQNFCEILTKIAKAIFSNENQNIQSGEALYILLDKQIFPLYDSLRSSNHIEYFEQIDFSLDNDSLAIIFNSKTVLLDIYQSYFPWEIKSSESFDILCKKSERALYKFSNEYNVTPLVINRAQFLKIWQDLVEIQEVIPSLSLFMCEEMGTAFTFKRFLLFLCRCAVIGKFHDIHVKLTEKIIMLLERMELSPGFHTLQMKTNRPFNGKTTFLSSQRIADCLSTIEIADPLSKSQTITLSPKKIGSNHTEKLEKLYDQYNRGEYFGMVGITSNKFVKFIEVLGIIQSDQGSKINKEDIEIIYTLATRKISKNNTPSSAINRKISYDEGSKMSYEQFEIALELVARKHFSDLKPDQAFDLFMENYIKKFDQVSENQKTYDRIINLRASLEGEELNKIYNIWKQAIAVFVCNYSDKANLYDFNAFFKFTSDFGIFPELISKQKITHIFNALLSFELQTDTIKFEGFITLNHANTFTIGRKVFIDGLALCALESKFSNQTPFLRLQATLEKILNSNGPALSVAKSGRTRTNKFKIPSNLLQLRAKEEDDRKAKTLSISFDSAISSKPSRRYE
ncbi:unnamed protein product [Blepharisma stoltei]|uniref:Uncharacterized protein n=1 Tax=Blepharisma stoltei TaxID=1481888 RepID=A0AAU9IXN5_9CILI|nr:unnamed protein product [Blepharisma stoltei]